MALINCPVSCLGSNVTVGPRGTGHREAVMGSKRQRRDFTPDEKARLIRRHLVDKAPISQLYNEAPAERV